MRLILIDETGDPPTEVLNLPSEATEVLPLTCENYTRNGYAPPWVGYLAVVDDECIGTCAFKSLPRAGRVEIAYYTFPSHEGKGFATRMAQELLALAHATDPSLTIFAQTLPQENASTSILRKLGFRLLGEIDHPEDGIVWEWEK